MSNYTVEEAEYLNMRPANVIVYNTAEFYHPDFGHVYLVQDQIFDKQLTVDGVPKTFQATQMKVPDVTAQSTDTTEAGNVNFGNVGLYFREKLAQITPLGAIKYPIECKIRKHKNDSVIYERSLYVANDGITIDPDNVSVKLSVDNPAKLTTTALFYDPALFVGLQDL